LHPHLYRFENGETHTGWCAICRTIAEEAELTGEMSAYVSGNDFLQCLKTYWEAASKTERQDFLAWVKSEGD
jgi:hypothetical protein